MTHSTFGTSTELTLGTTYTANIDGYLYVQIAATSSTDTALVRAYLNGSTFVNLRASAYNTQGIPVYVKKGMTYKVEGVGTAASASATFRPLSE